MSGFSPWVVFSKLAKSVCDSGDPDRCPNCRKVDTEADTDPKGRPPRG